MATSLAGLPVMRQVWGPAGCWKGMQRRVACGAGQAHTGWVSTWSLGRPTQGAAQGRPGSALRWDVKRGGGGAAVARPKVHHSTQLVHPHTVVQPFSNQHHSLLPHQRPTGAALNAIAPRSHAVQPAAASSAAPAHPAPPTCVSSLIWPSCLSLPAQPPRAHLPAATAAFSSS
jgi:hypothetical protein